MTKATASLELWRPPTHELPTIETSGTMFHRGKPKDMHAPTLQGASEPPETGI